MFVPELVWQTIPNQMKQLALGLPERGGKRKGAGRKCSAARPRVSHKSRPRFSKAAPVLVTLRVAFGVWNLRSQRCFRIVEGCLADARGRFGLHVIEFSVLGNHLHLVVEADSDVALSRGMQGLGVRIARALNRLMQRRGSVFDDHYHSRLLGSPTELVKAIAYVLGNHAHHFGGEPSARDPFCSSAYDLARRQAVLSRPRTWLLCHGWRRARWIPRWVDAPGWYGPQPNAVT
jgi:putative transposase